MSRKKPSLAKNALSNWTTLGIHVVLGFVMTPIIIRYVGKNGYGIWTLVHSFAGYYGLLNLGVRSAVMRYVARDAEVGDTKGLNATVSTAFFLFLFTGSLMILVSVLLAEPLAGFFDISDANRRAFTVLVYVIGISTWAEFLNMVFTAVLGGYEKYVAINIVNSLSYVGRAVFIVWALRAGWGLAAPAYGTLGMSLAVLAAKWAVCGFRIKELKLSLRSAHWSTMKTLIGYGIPSIVITVSSLVRTKFDNVIIGRFVDVSAVAIYGVASLIIQYFFNAINTGIGVITPRFARLGGRQKKDEQQNLFTRSLFVGAVLACGGGMMIVLFGARFISFWVGEGFEAAVPVLWILTAAYVPELAQSSAFGLLLAENKHRGLAKLSLGEAVANLSISIVLVIKFGIIGAALGTAIPMMVTKLIIQPVLVSRTVGLPLGSYYKPLIFPLITGVVITGAGVFGGMTPLLEATKLVGFVAIGVAVGILYLLLVYMMTRNLPYMPDLASVFRNSTSA